MSDFQALALLPLAAFVLIVALILVAFRKTDDQKDCEKATLAYDLTLANARIKALLIENAALKHQRNLASKYAGRVGSTGTGEV